MVDVGRARQLFELGVLSMGIAVEGTDPVDNPQQAALAFTRASEWDPGMADAWIGRLACGPAAVGTGDAVNEALLAVYRHRDAIGREQRRLGLPPGLLVGRWYTGMFIDYPLVDADHAVAAYAATLIRGHDLAGAAEVLSQITGDAPIAEFMTGVLHFSAQRWPDVLTALGRTDSWADEYLGSAADYMCGSACVQLGMFTEGLRRLQRAIDGPIPSCATRALFALGLALRETGQEDQARAAFEQAFSRDPAFTAAADAMRSQTLRLTVTSAEEIAARADMWDPASTPGTDAADPPSVDGDDLVARAQRDLDAQIGLESVKEQVAKLKSAATLARIRADRGLSTSARSLHLAFTGPPGTGKTTIARVIATLYCGLGFIKSDKVIEATRRDLVGEHLGSTAIKTSTLIDSAMDGVLFIDEAYTLIQQGLSGGDAFGREAVDTLLARMEDDRDRLVVIIAGYDAEIGRFLAANEGLGSRFARRVRFESYTPGELARIGEFLAAQRDSILTAEAMAELEQACTPLYHDVRQGPGGTQRATDLAGNGRFIRNIIEAAEEEREVRLSAGGDLENLTHDELMRIEVADLRAALNSVLSGLAPARTLA
ncbi:type VII secretion AAA-ATPase EccA [Gordonia polyisoprenivorans]|uniref:type VII secretion AAA-ATPase EccA n=1 Tax=Gordonia polyisoprenivorans TaxID=84595 RepID=UPI00036B3226|nr:type VII secretion AAA-ATPase EccA [Gordonia polyisoprenivorans]